MHTHPHSVASKHDFYEYYISEYQPALEGRSIINLQMSDTAAAFQDITVSVKVKPSAELLTNRGVIHQVTHLYCTR